MISWKLKISGCQPIGLDIGRNTIKMIQLAVNDGHIKVVAADKVRIDGSINGDVEERRSFVVSAIKQMLSEGNFRGRKVISCLPNDELKITSLRVAETEEEQIEQALGKEVSQRFGLDVDRDGIDYMVAGNVQQGDEIKNELIVFAADNEAIKRHIETLEDAELRPVAIDTIPCALFRSFERSLRRQEDRENTVVFVEVGSRFTTVVFGRGGEISFVKQIPIGGEKFNREIGAKLGIGVEEARILRGKLWQERMSLMASIGPVKSCEASSQDSTEQGSVGGDDELDASTRQVMDDAVTGVAEELAREISLCLRYYTVTFRGKRVERAVFAGGEAYENSLLNVLKRQLTVEIEVAQPMKGFDLSSERAKVNLDGDRRGLLCEWAVAVGLGLKGLEGN